MAQTPTSLEDVNANLEQLKRTVKEKKYEEKIPCAEHFLDNLDQIANEGNVELIDNFCHQTLEKLETAETSVDKVIVDGFKKSLEGFLRRERPTAPVEESKKRSQSIPLDLKTQLYRETYSSIVKVTSSQNPSHTYHPSHYTTTDKKQDLSQASHAGQKHFSSITLKPSSLTTKDLKKETEQASAYERHEKGSDLLLQEKRTQELEELHKTYDSLEKNYKKLETEYEKLQDQCKELEEINKKMTNDFNRQLSDKQKLVTNLEKTAEESFGKNQDLEVQLYEQFCENERLKKNNDHLEDTLKTNKRINSERITTLTKERDDLRNRYSKLAGQKLKDNNSDITDLSDPNRPMKLAEKLSELYDNEWTDAFQMQVDKLKRTEKEATQFLLRMLEECYNHCKEMAEKQMEMLTTVFFHHGQDMTKTFLGPSTKFNSLPDDNILDLSRLKAFADNKIKVKEKPRLHTNEEKALLEVRKLISASKPGPAKQSFLPEVAKKCDPNERAIPEVNAYLEKCVDVCWFLAVNDPPLYMDMVFKPGTKIDTNLYTCYYTPGDKADFLVWPPLFSHQNGGLINKGVMAPVQEKKKLKK